MSSPSNKRRKSQSSQQQRLFSTLATIEQTDARATQRRKQSHLSSLSQSKAANDQVRLNGILLELRILMQRCLDLGQVDNVDNVSVVVEGDRNGSGSKGEEEVQVEIHSLLENLLIARRDLLGHEFILHKDESDGNLDCDDDGDNVDYAALIRLQDSCCSNMKGESNDDDSSSSGSGRKGDEGNSNSDDDDNNKINLSTQLKNEYESLRTSWKSILNKHHSNLALHSGMSFNSSKFQSKAVDLSFWDQVKFAASKNHGGGEKGGGGTLFTTKGKDFDDSKLYQQMLKDFISQSSGSATGGGGKRSGSLDPAQEAAERLKRAMRKKNGIENVDLSTLLRPMQEGSDLRNSNITTAAPAAAKKVNVDRRASKGRKIRYTVHPKLVNFTFPVARPEPTIKEDIWFKSLFGGVGKL